jgi:hypothetical protein
MFVRTKNKYDHQTIFTQALNSFCATWQTANTEQARTWGAAHRTRKFSIYNVFDLFVYHTYGRTFWISGCQISDMDDI